MKQHRIVITIIAIMITLTSCEGMPTAQHPATVSSPTTFHFSNAYQAARGSTALTTVFGPEWRTIAPQWTPGWEWHFITPAEMAEAISESEATSTQVGYADSNNRELVFTVRHDLTDYLVAHVIGHELGHYLNMHHLTLTQQRRWLEAEGMDPTGAWWTFGVDDRFNQNAAGHFAEAVSVTLTGGTSLSTMGNPNAAQRQIIAEAFASAGWPS